MAKKELRRISFEPAKGGAISRTEMRTARGGKGGGPEFDHHEEVAVHPTMKHAQEHMGKVMAGCFGERSGEESEKE